MKRPFLIYSHTWSKADGANRWWGPGGRDYFNLDGAGRFTVGDARKMSKHTGDQDEVVQLGSSRFLTLIRGEEVDTVIWKYMNLLENAKNDAFEEAAVFCETDECAGWLGIECAVQIRKKLKGGSRAARIHAKKDRKNGQQEKDPD